MRRPKKGQEVARLEKARQRFEIWRSEHNQGNRQLPDKLWKTAVELARFYGIPLTARSLGLSNSALRQRTIGGEAVAPVTKPTFVEAYLGESITPGGNLIEVETVSGIKMRIQLKGGGALEAAAFVRALGVGA